MMPVLYMWHFINISLTYFFFLFLHDEAQHQPTQTQRKQRRLLYFISLVIILVKDLKSGWRTPTTEIKL